MPGSLNGELETKQVKIIGYHVPPVPVPEQLARFALKFAQSLKKDCLYKKVAVFFVIIQFSIFKRISLIQNNSFLWKIYKCFKINEAYQKRRHPFCSYCHLLSDNNNNNNNNKNEKTFFLSSCTQEGWETTGSGTALP